MQTMAMRRVMLRPQVSPMWPKISAPMGRTTKPTAYTAHQSCTGTAGRCGWLARAGYQLRLGMIGRQGLPLAADGAGGEAAGASAHQGLGGGVGLGEEHLLQHGAELGVCGAGEGAGQKRMGGKGVWAGNR